MKNYYYFTLNKPLHYIILIIMVELFYINNNGIKVGKPAADGVVIKANAWRFFQAIISLFLIN